MKGKETSSRIVVSFTVAGLVMALVDLLGGAVSRGVDLPGPLAACMLALTGAGVGALAGGAMAVIVRLAGVKGPSRDLVLAPVVRALTSRITLSVLVIVVAALPVAAGVIARSRLLGSSWVAAAVDVAVVSMVLAVALLAGRIGDKGDARLSARLFGAVFSAGGFLCAVALAFYRSATIQTGLWDLLVFLPAVLVALGLILLLPSTPKVRTAAKIAGPAAVILCVASIFSFNWSDDLRDQGGGGWLPAGWMMSTLTEIVDMDGDGFSPLFGHGDCDDGDWRVNPAGIEIPGNGVDENCRNGDEADELPWPTPPAYVPLPDDVEAARSVLLIVVDSMRPDHLGAYGYERNTSPNMDRFAEGAVLFENAYSTAPTTRIAMPSLFTGRPLARIYWDRSRFPYGMLDRNTTFAEVASREGIETAAFITHRYLGRKWNFCQGFKKVDKRLALSESTFRQKATGAKLAKNAVDWITRHKDERFLAWVHFMDPHSRYLKHKDGTDWGDDEVDRYDSEIEYSDKAVGVILDALEDLGIDDTTAVLILADHGEFLGEHGRNTHGGKGIWQEGARIPLFIKVPGLKPRTTDCLVGMTDLAPTILNILGIDGSEMAPSGGTLLPVMTGAKCDPEREIPVELRFGPRSGTDVRALVGMKWKLILNAKTGTYRLFDIENDPGEQANLAGRETGVLKEMKDRLGAWMAVNAVEERKELLAASVFDELPDGATPLTAAFEGGVEFVGADLGSGSVSKDRPLMARLFIRLGEPLEYERCRIGIDVVDERADAVWTEAHTPVNGALPVRAWPAGKIVEDTFMIKLKAGSLGGAGTYRIKASMRCDGETLGGVNDDVDSRGRADLGEVWIGKRKDRGKGRK